MKKKHIILLCILLAVVLALGWIAYKQRNNIGAVVDTFRYSKEDVEKKLEENKQDLQKFIDENENINVRDLTDEEKVALNKGELTEQDVISIITGKLTIEDVKKPPKTDTPGGQQEEKPPQNPTPNGSGQQGGETSTEQPNPPAENTSDQIVSELIAKLYVQKNNYLSRLNGMESQVENEYNALPDDQKASGKKSIVSKYMSIVAGWESECDGVVYGILDEIKAELAKSGKDQSVVKKIEEAYLNEKKLKKAYYMNIYLDRVN